MATRLGEPGVDGSTYTSLFLSRRAGDGGQVAHTGPTTCSTPTAKSDQSARSALVGLILAARCAGIQAAARPTDASARVATASVAGS